MENFSERSAGSFWSRRRLLRTGALGTVGLGAAALIGCSNSGTSSGTPKAPAAGGPPTVAGQPKRGGTIKAVYNYDVPTYNIHNPTTAGQGAIMMGSIYSGLLRFSWKEQWKADVDIAEKWESPDPTRWVFTLRKGVKWHDGKAFTSKDAALSLPFTQTLKSGPLARVKPTFETPDDNTLVIKLSSPAPYLPGQLARLQSKLIRPDVIERKAEDKEFIGTGPWKYERHEAGQGWYYTKNPDFYLMGADGKPLPYADKLARVVITAAPAGISAISTGQVHTLGAFPSMLPSQIAVIKRTAGEKVVVNELANGMSRMFVNAGRKPFDDKRVRMAAHLAMDRPDIVRRGYEGALVPGVLDARESGKYALSKEDLAKLPGFRTSKDEDLKEARALLAAAGYASGGPTLELIGRQTSVYVETATVVNDNLIKVGFKPTFQSVESSVGIVRQNKGEFDMGTVLPAGDTDPLLHLQSMLLTVPSANNHSYLKGSEWEQKVVDVIAKALGATNEGERIQAAHDVQKYVCTGDSGVFAIGGSTGYVMNARELKDNYPAPTTSGESFYEAWLDQ